MAEEGYSGMLEGKLDVIAGVTLSQRVLLRAVPVTPKKLALKQVRQMQEVE